MSNLVPSLRFPEFKDSGEWSFFIIKNLFNEYNIKNSDNYPQYTIGKNGILPIKEHLHNIDGHKIFSKNDLIIGIGIDEINVNIFLENGCCSPIYSVHKTDTNLVFPEFVYFYIKTYMHRNKNMFTKKSTRREFEINKKQLLDESILLPSLPEQTKIASFLSLIDNRIEALSEQLELTRDYKKGMMQRIFSQEYRFKDDEGNEYPEWVRKSFKDVTKLQRGSSPRPIVKFITNSFDGVNWIKIGDTKLSETYITYTTEKITKEGALKSRQVFSGEIILSNSMSYGKPYILAIDGYIHDGWFVIRDYEKNFNTFYLYQLLGSDLIQKQYKRLAAGGVVDNISGELVNSVQLNLPSLLEQTKIATFLSSIDNRIEALSEQLEQTKLFKKAMLQRVLV